MATTNPTYFAHWSVFLAHHKARFSTPVDIIIKVEKEWYNLYATVHVQRVLPVVIRARDSGYPYVWMPLWARSARAGVLDSWGVAITPAGGYIDERGLPKDDLTREVYLRKMIPIWEQRANNQRR